MKNFPIILILVVYSFTSCTKSKTTITNEKDYASYLTSTSTVALKKLQDEQNFWLEKLEKTPGQYPYYSKIASTNSELFNTTGKIDYLIETEKNLLIVNERTNYTKSASLRALARNYISQHRFDEALLLLEKAESLGERLIDTQKMLFDVHLELGNNELAKTYLYKFNNPKDFDFLIRLSKWNDHKGNLKAAIGYLESATKIAERNENKNLMQWSYTNLADFYGHNNELKKSYNFYLKALQLNPNDAYALKGIAWIVYSYEKNAPQALHILNAINTKYNAPDYYLLKAEIAEFQNNIPLKKESIELYLAAVKNKKYGHMYNKYNALLFSEELNKHAEAISIAKAEIALRPTAQSFDLLAWAYFKEGKKAAALNIVEASIANKTFEPEVQYHMAEIYKANGLNKRTLSIKKELLGSLYELGPVLEKKIKTL